MEDDGAPTFTVSDLPAGRPLRIVVYGDMRFTDAGNTSDTHPGVRKWLAQKVGEEKPDILLLTGDMPFHGSNPADWKIYSQETALWTQEQLRIYPTIGNHEGLTDPRSGMMNYFAAYPQIDHHRWYSVQTGKYLSHYARYQHFPQHRLGAAAMARCSAGPSSFVGGFCFLSFPRAAGFRSANCFYAWHSRPDFT